MDLIIPTGCEKYASYQCDCAKRYYSTNPEILHRLKPYLIDLKPKYVLELGCGLGRMSAVFNKAFNWKTVVFYLYDGDSGNFRIGGLNDISGSNFYNKLSMTKKFCLANGLKTKQIILINAEKFSLRKLNKPFSLIYSFLAIGYHWPINEYLKDIYRLLVPDGLFIFETVHGREDVLHWNFNKTCQITGREFINNQIKAILQLDFEFEIVERKQPLIIVRKIK